MTDIMEQIRYNLLDRNKSFPRLYNKVHMSNVPYVFCIDTPNLLSNIMSRDYVGGPLATALYASSITKLTPGSSATSVCMRNGFAWDSINTFHNECSLAADPVTLRKLWNLTLTDEDLAFRWSTHLGARWI